MRRKAHWEAKWERRHCADHNTRLVIGRTLAHTLELREDAHGLWGRILINTNDSDAMNQALAALGGITEAQALRRPLRR